MGMFKFQGAKISHLLTFVFTQSFIPTSYALCPIYREINLCTWLR